MNSPSCGTEDWAEAKMTNGRFLADANRPVAFGAAAARAQSWRSSSGRPALETAAAPGISERAMSIDSTVTPGDARVATSALRA